MSTYTLIENPYRPGAGHQPPFLAGRSGEQLHFKRMLTQSHLTDNVLVTGLRGFGKTVLLGQMQKAAEAGEWLWIGNDLSESSALSEDRMALRILTDLAQVIAERIAQPDRAGLQPSEGLQGRLEQLARVDRDGFTFAALKAHYEQAPGLPSDRLRAVLMRVMKLAQKVKLKGIVLAYDEAQCLSDRAAADQFPMSMLIETVSALQKKPGPVALMLVLCGLPQVFDALTQARTYTERMFHVMTLERLSREETRAALTVPLATMSSQLNTPPALIEKVMSLTGGYPYLIQFFGREMIEQLLENGGTLPAEKFPSSGAFERLDAGLFSARWNRTTDKQRELLGLIASRAPNANGEFSARELEQLRLETGDGGETNITQMLGALCERGMLFRTRHGHYAFTVPMSEAMIARRLRRLDEMSSSWDTHTESAGIDTAPKTAANEDGPIVEEPKDARKRKRGWFGR
jgi:AAA ATPase domain